MRKLVRRAAESFTAAAILALMVCPAARGAFPGQNGQIAFSSDRNGNFEVYKMNADGSGVAQLTNTGTYAIEPTWSEDGAVLAFNLGSEIYRMDASGGGQTALTANPANLPNDHPSWSPDGEKIVFGSARDTSFEIYAMNADGSAQTRLTNNPAFDARPSFSPLGDKIVFDTDRDGNYEIYTMNPTGSGLTRLTNSAGMDYDAAWSPDGSKIAFSSDREGSFHVYTMNADGSGQAKVSNSTDDREPAWSPDGTRIAFLSGRDGNAEIYVMSADGSNPTRLTNNPAFDSGPDWQPLPVAGNHPPHCARVVATPASLARPNHKFVAVALSGATDPDGDGMTLSVTGVTQDEPTSGEPDAAPGVTSNQVRLRAERDGSKDGRVYRIAFQASDRRGGACAGAVKVGVPKGSGVPVDSAPPSYDSFGS